MKRDSFVFYESFYTAIKELPEDQQLEVYRAICEYALNGELPEDGGIAKAMLCLIKPQIDANNKRWENGKKGGRKAETETESEPKKNQTETKAEPNANQTETESEPNENANDNDNDNDNGNENGNANGDVNAITPPIPPTGAEGAEPQEKPPDLQERRFDEFWELYPKKKSKESAKKAWKKIKPTQELHERILQSVKDHMARDPNWQKEHGQYIPYPASWLNAGGWDDELPAAQQRGGEADARRNPGADHYTGFQSSRGFRTAYTEPNA